MYTKNRLKLKYSDGLNSVSFKKFGIFKIKE